jgi:hypothetical protein
VNKARRREFLKAVGTAALGAGYLSAGTGGLRAQEGPDMANEGREFKPGEKVERSGVYDVLHDRLDGDTHAEHHRVIVIAGSVFPDCKGCREWVRFRLYVAAEHIAADVHFRT